MRCFLIWSALLPDDFDALRHRELERPSFSVAADDNPPRHLSSKADVRHVGHPTVRFEPAVVERQLYPDWMDGTDQTDQPFAARNIPEGGFHGHSVENVYNLCIICLLFTRWNSHEVIIATLFSSIFNFPIQFNFFQTNNLFVNGLTIPQSSWYKIINV